MVKKILIIGFGKVGKRYFSLLKNIKDIEIIVCKKSVINSKNVKVIYNLKNTKEISGVIIASPLNTHFRYAKFFLDKKIPVLLEKPVCKSFSQAEKLKNLSLKNKISLIINYSDLFDVKLMQLIKLTSNEFNRIKEFSMSYGNNRNKYYFKKNITPSADWLPHPVSLIAKICEKVDNYFILDYKYKINKNNLFFEKFKIRFIKKNNDIILNFSNFPKTNMRNLYLRTQNKEINFDAYNYKNNYFVKGANKKRYIKNKISSFENITNFFLKMIKDKKYYSNIDLGLKEMKITYGILKKIMYLRKNIKNLA